MRSRVSHLGAGVSLGTSINPLATRHPADDHLYHVRLPVGAGRERSTLGLFPAPQFGSFAATMLVREADVYGAAPYATHATQVGERTPVMT